MLTPITHVLDDALLGLNGDRPRPAAVVMAQGAQRRERTGASGLGFHAFDAGVGRSERINLPQPSWVRWQVGKFADLLLSVLQRCQPRAAYSCPLSRINKQKSGRRVAGGDLPRVGTLSTDVLNGSLLRLNLDGSRSAAWFLARRARGCECAGASDLVFHSILRRGNSRTLARLGSFRPKLDAASGRRVGHPAKPLEVQAATLCHLAEKAAVLLIPIQPAPGDVLVHYHHQLAGPCRCWADHGPRVPGVCADDPQDVLQRCGRLGWGEANGHCHPQNSHQPRATKATVTGSPQTVRRALSSIPSSLASSCSIRRTSAETVVSSPSSSGSSGPPTDGKNGGDCCGRKRRNAAAEP